MLMFSTQLQRRYVAVVLVLYLDKEKMGNVNVDIIFILYLCYRLVKLHSGGSILPTNIYT